MTPHIARLIAQAEQWRAEHRAAKRGVEAAACEIRIQALYDAAAVPRPKPRDRGDLS